MIRLASIRPKRGVKLTLPIDVVAAYWMFFGRAPESEAVSEEKAGLPYESLTSQLLGSQEFFVRATQLSLGHWIGLIDRTPGQDIGITLAGSEYMKSFGAYEVSKQFHSLSAISWLLRNVAVARLYDKIEGLPTLPNILAQLDTCINTRGHLRQLYHSWSGAASREDIQLAYQFILGREAENEPAISAKLGMSIASLILSLLGSEEFSEIVQRVLSGELVTGYRYHHSASQECLSWCQARGVITSDDIGIITTPKEAMQAFMRSELVTALEREGLLTWPADSFRDRLKNIDDGLSSHQKIDGKIVHVYDRSILHLITNRIYDLPEVVIDPSAPKRINVLVPAFEFKSMSAGFFGVFQVARFIASCGYRVRLVMFDNFYWNESEFRQKLLGYPGMERLFDELDVTYIGDRSAPLRISPFDSAMATVWYSAYFAQKICRLTENKPFLYLIQDYETNFFAGGSHFALAEESYSMNYTALFSTEPLQRFFIENRIGRFSDPDTGYMFFNNACASYLPTETNFKSRGKSRRLAFYSRPIVNRNMFELGALALIQAFQSGVFKDREWEFIGVGMGDAAVQLSPGRKLLQLERMNLKDYTQAIATFDLGLCLMASPHPSLLPFDLAGSGAIVVTNRFMTKQELYFKGISGNIIVRGPTLPDLIDGLVEGVSRAEDFDARYHHASNMRYPTDWDECFTDKHATFIKNTFN